MSEEEELSHTQVLADVEKQIKAVCKLLQRQANRLHEEQEAFDSMAKKMENMQFSSTVKLNVGGHHFTTSIQTLTKDPNSMLAAMFSGRFEMKPSKDGTFFIDRDGTYFRFILNYLRDGKLSLPEGATFLEEIQAEAEFYQIQGILDELEQPRPAARSRLGSSLSKPFEESEILTPEDRKALLDMLPYRRGKWRLLFRASRDGFAAKAFHSKCDNKGPTVTIVKSGSFIFGGFTEAAWITPENHRTEYIPSMEAFLFSLVNPYRVEPVKMPTEEGRRASNIVCRDSLGPSFGGDKFYRCDLSIADNADSSRTSYNQLSTCHQCPEGKQGSTFLTGSKQFLVIDYEVFEFH